MQPSSSSNSRTFSLATGESLGCSRSLSPSPSPPPWSYRQSLFSGLASCGLFSQVNPRAGAFPLHLAPPASFSAFTYIVCDSMCVLPLEWLPAWLCQVCVPALQWTGLPAGSHSALHRPAFPFFLTCILGFLQATSHSLYCVCI